MFEHMLLKQNNLTQAPEVTSNPSGPNYSSPILASDGGVDWLGEVPASELITGDALASLIGLTAGTSQHSDAGWLHVGLDGTELLIAKRPLRHTVSWDHLNTVNAVYGNRTVNIGGVDYKVRLLKGVNSDPTTGGMTYDGSQTHGSEWNRIFYRLTDENYLNVYNTKASEEPFLHLAQYSEEDLLLHSNFGNGTYQWCQETHDTERIYRGRDGVSNFFSLYSGYSRSFMGWRPVLEKVSI